MRLLLVVLLAAGGVLGACNSRDAQDRSSSEGVDATSSTRPEYAPELIGACESGAHAYDGVPIAAFEDPSTEGVVTCWADGRVAKSPPPNPDGSTPPSFDRLVFTARMDGAFIALLRAGYRDQMPVTPP